MRGPRAGNALQEVFVCVCVHEVGNRGGFLGARRWIFFLFFFGCSACAWTGTAPGVLGRRDSAQTCRDLCQSTDLNKNLNR